MEHSASNIDKISKALLKHVNSDHLTCHRSVRSILINKDDYDDVYLNRTKKYCPLDVEGGGGYNSWYLTHHADKYYYMCISDGNLDHISFQETKVRIKNLYGKYIKLEI